MKKFKSFFCSIFMLIIGLTRFACITNNDGDINDNTTPSTTKVNITLNEARTNHFTI